MKRTTVHKQLLLATLALQRQEVGHHLGALKQAARGLSQEALDQAQTAGTWASAAAALWSLRGIFSRTSKRPSRQSGRGLWSWGRTLVSVALAVRPLTRLVAESRAPRVP